MQFPTIQSFLSRLWSHHLSTFVIILTKMTLPFLMLLSMSLWIHDLLKSNLCTWMCYKQLFSPTLLICCSNNVFDPTRLFWIKVPWLQCHHNWIFESLPIKCNGEMLLELPPVSSIGTFRTIARYAQKIRWSCLVQVTN
jgi:hypothetical protein